jgi:hypothetical protein
LKIKALPVVVALAVIAAGATGWIVWDRTQADRVRTGHAFGDDGAVATIGMRTVRKGDEAWYLAPSMTNLTDKPLTVEAVSWAQVSPGLEYIDARVYRRDDFAGALPLAWGTADGSSSSPTRVPSKPVQGYVLKAGQDLNDVIYLHLRVTTDTRPLESNGVAVEYSQRGKRYRQVLPAVFKLEQPASASN